MREFLIAALTGLIAIDLVLCGPLCHQCSRIPYPRDCDVIKRCGDSEACFIDKEVNSNGAVLYSTGCRSKQRCGALAARGAITQRSEDAEKENTPISNVTVQDTPPEDTMDVLVCDQCCDTNFCNVKGCGSQDFPPRSDRGPVCLSCHQHLHPGTCDRIELCTIDEQCYVLPFSSTFDVIYSSGCMPTSQCLSINTTQPDALSLIGKRGVGTRCNSCCAEDYCNINCEMTEPTTVLPSMKHTSSTQTQTSRTTTAQVTTSPEPAHATSNILITQVGTWSAWSYYGACSTTCGAGTMERTRQCQGGTSCPGIATETAGCNTGVCPTVSTWSAWSYFGACSTTCGVGTFERMRQCQDGTSCPGNAREAAICNTGVCQTVGTWSAWSYYGACSTTCGVGTMERTRQCQGGTSCPGNAKQTSGCNTGVCPTVGTWSAWSYYGACSTTCDVGTFERMRQCQGGTSCPGNAKETAGCTTGVCPTVGTWSAWSYYGACSTTCGVGTMERTRQCQGGTSCPGNAKETAGCNTGVCPTVGTWSAWSYYGACSTTCGVGIFERTRQCQAGKSCPGNVMETAGCNTGVCPTVGTWSAWSYYGACSTTCGVGTMERTHQCQGGTGCTGNVKEKSGCNTGVCPTVGK